MFLHDQFNDKTGLQAIEIDSKLRWTKWVVHAELAAGLSTDTSDYE